MFITTPSTLIVSIYSQVFGYICYSVLSEGKNQIKSVVQITPLQGNTGHPSLSNHLNIPCYHGHTRGSWGSKPKPSSLELIDILFRNVRAS